MSPVRVRSSPPVSPNSSEGQSAALRRLRSEVRFLFGTLWPKLNWSKLQVVNLAVEGSSPSGHLTGNRSWRPSGFQTHRRAFDSFIPCSQPSGGMADTLVLETSAARRASSTLAGAIRRPTPIGRGSRFKPGPVSVRIRGSLLCLRNSADRVPDFESGGRGFKSCRGRFVV
jgi:hypothetical protein